MPTEHRPPPLLITQRWFQTDGTAGAGEATDAAISLLKTHPGHYQKRLDTAVSHAHDRSIQIIPGPNGSADPDHNLIIRDGPEQNTLVMTESESCRHFGPHTPQEARNEPHKCHDNPHSNWSVAAVIIALILAATWYCTSPWKHDDPNNQPIQNPASSFPHMEAPPGYEPLQYTPSGPTTAAFANTERPGQHRPFRNAPPAYETRFRRHDPSGHRL